MNSTSLSAELPDAQLLERCLHGERDAFGVLVHRYQGVVCAQAYAVCGDFGKSEDVAQEAFLSAWRQLRELRDHTRFKAWLCGMARHLALRVVTRREREAQPRLTTPEPTSAEPDPHAQLVSREEQARLWRLLETLPASYREALVLFYREHQSIAAVAETLGISTDAVKQRLTRGRALLREELIAQVEHTLTRSGPSPTFAVGVLALLGTSSAPLSLSGSALATSAESAVAAKSLGVLFWPVVGLVGNVFTVCLAAWYSAASAAEQAAYERERQFIRAQGRWTVGLSLAFGLSVIGVALLGKLAHRATPAVVVISVIIVAYCTALFISILRLQRGIQRIRQEEEARGTPRRQLSPQALAQGGARGAVEYVSPVRFLGWPLVHFCFNDQGTAFARRKFARGWLAISDHGAIGGIAFGLFAQGIFCFGVVSVGVLSFGALSFGVAAVAGLACGVWSAGGLAAGGIVHGGSAFAWEIAQGGAAYSLEYAVGGLAHAPHAKDALARAAAANSLWLRTVSWPGFSAVITLLSCGFSMSLVSARSWAARRLGR